jgi:Tol biopolymer transport system component
MIIKKFIDAFRLLISMLLALSLFVSPGQAQSSIPDLPRHGFQNEPDFISPVVGSSFSRPESVQTSNIAQLPASRVVFQSYRDGNYEIYAANNDGSAISRLTNNTATDMQPRLNRGGTKIAFSSKRSGNYDIYSMNPDGSVLTRLTTNSKDDANPAWSPDGLRILFQSYRDGQSEIYVMNADGANQVRLTNNSGYDGEPEWSPDGSKIVWCTNRNGGFTIWVMNANGSQAAQLSTQAYSEDPIFSPDGSQIAYDADGNGNGWMEVWLMNADGSNQHVVYTPGGANQDALVRGWSPDGAWITYTHVYYINQNNTWYWTDAFLKIVSPTQTPPTETDLFGTNLDWQPDWQTLDNVTPASTIQALPATSPGDFIVSWSGSDSGGSELKNFDIQMRDGVGGLWTNWILASTASSAAFPGIGGHVYYFRIRGRDNASNVESWPADYDASTMVENQPPDSSADELQPYSASPVSISWSGVDKGGSEIKGYDVQYRDIQDVSWADWKLNTNLTSEVFNGQVGHTYAFRVRAVDTAFNQEDWPSNLLGDSMTTLYSYGLNGRTTDNTGTPLAEVAITTDPTSFVSVISDLRGIYNEYIATDAASFSADWSKSGYGSPEKTEFTPPGFGDTHLDVVMPPADGVLKNGGMESTNLFDGWAASGSLPPVLTTDTLHTGTSAVFMGQKSLDVKFTVPYPLGPKLDVPTMTYDTFGNLHVLAMGVLADKIAYYMRDLNGAWSAETVVWDKGSGKPAMVIDKANTLHALWIAPSSPYLSTEGWGDLYYANKPVNGTWSSPQAIYHLDADQSSSYFNDTPVLIMSPDGTLNVAWNALVPSINPSISMFFLRRSPTGDWSAPVDMFSDAIVGIGTWKFKLVLGNDGVVYAFANSFCDRNDNENHICFKNLKNDGTWSPIVFIANGNGLDVAADGNNGLHLVYSSDGMYYVHIDPGGSVSAPALFWQQTFLTGFPRLAVGSDLTIHVIWNDHALYYAEKPLHGTWTTAQKIHGYVIGYYDILVDPANIVHVMVGLSYSRKFPGKDWDPEITAGNQYSCVTATRLERPFIVLPDETVHIVCVDSDRAYLRYIESIKVDMTGDSHLSQTISIPEDMTHPILSFMYQLSGAAKTDSRQLSMTVTGPSGAPTTIGSISADTIDWVHQWYDLSSWKGQTVDLAFNLHQELGQPPTWAVIDDVSLGSGNPDLWVQSSGSSGPPGNSILIPITYGNQSEVRAEGVMITLTLPAKLTFVSANLTPTTVSGQVLTWAVGDLAGRTGPLTIQVAATVAADAVRLSTIDGSAEISTTSTELEKANNTIQTHIFIGARVMLPMLRK